MLEEGLMLQLPNWSSWDLIAVVTVGHHTDVLFPFLVVVVNDRYDRCLDRNGHLGSLYHSDVTPKMDDTSWPDAVQTSRLIDSGDVIQAVGDVVIPPCHCFGEIDGFHLDCPDSFDTPILRTCALQSVSGECVTLDDSCSCLEAFTSKNQDAVEVSELIHRLQTTRMVMTNAFQQSPHWDIVHQKETNIASVPAVFSLSEFMFTPKEDSELCGRRLTRAQLHHVLCHRYIGHLYSIKAESIAAVQAIKTITYLCSVLNADFGVPQDNPMPLCDDNMAEITRMNECTTVMCHGF
jgi:hypothetical protein